MLKPIEMAEITENNLTEKKREVKGPYYQTFDIVCILVFITIVVLWYFYIFEILQVKKPHDDYRILFRKSTSITSISHL